MDYASNSCGLTIYQAGLTEYWVAADYNYRELPMRTVMPAD